MRYSKSLILVCSAIIYWGAIVTTFLLDFKYPLPEEIIIASSLDWFLTTVVVVLILNYNKKRFLFFDSYFSLNVKNSFEKNEILIYFILCILFVFCLGRADLILSGATREMLVFEEDSSRFIMIASPLFVFVSAVSLVYDFKLRIKAALLFGVVLVSIYNLSRAEIASLIFSIITLVLFRGISLRKIAIAALLFSFLILLSISVTIYQGRADSLESALEAVFVAFFKYKAFSLYLSDFSIRKIDGDLEQIFYPFFGFAIERILTIIQPLSNPISVQDSTFISDFRSLGLSNAYDGNVLYSWWSWFYGAFGIVGLFFKMIFIYVILNCLIKSKLAFTFFYMLYICLFTAYFRHPFLNSSSLYAIITLFLLDILIIKFHSRSKLHF